LRTYRKKRNLLIAKVEKIEEFFKNHDSLIGIHYPINIMIHLPNKFFFFHRFQSYFNQ